MAALTVNCVIGSGVFGLPSQIAAYVGRASIAAVLMAGAVAGVIMACFAEVASRFTDTGGPYLYVRTAFGRLMGVETAWLVWFVRLTACAANVNLFVTYLAEFWPPATNPIPRFSMVTLLVAVIAGINFRGVRMGTHVNNIFTAAKLSALALVAIAGGWFLLHTVGAPGLAVFARPGNGSPSPHAWAQAMVLLVFAYGGFEAALISTGEVENPRRDTVFGLFAALVICTTIYALIQWVVVGVLPDPGHSTRPLADVARTVMGPTGASLVAVGALFSIYGYLSGNMLAVPRMTFALAERGDFPSVFAAVHPNFRTPHISILVFALLLWLFSFFGNFTGNATLSAGARLFYYGAVCAALPALRNKQPGAALFRLPAGNLFGVLGLVLCIALVTRVDFSNSLLLGSVIAVGFVNWLLLKKKQT